MSTSVHITRVTTDPLDGPSFGCLPGTNGHTVVLRNNSTGEYYTVHVCVPDGDTDGAGMIAAITDLTDPPTYNVVDP